MSNPRWITATLPSALLSAWWLTSNRAPLALSYRLMSLKVAFYRKFALHLPLKKVHFVWCLSSNKKQRQLYLNWLRHPVVNMAIV
ncbi:Uncharacterised protein [Vibrio cholerae]|uniref:Uncharacterized protein n=1 Tax=Vibrio cholerae TaxID=666 RepID=A0A656A8N5_VIBCL|nr:Uncharacterised protein [Vibrio cholerae]CSB22479.1 Uncharacterised protein [Vibrio cholerae]CSB31780.1 Uncharacterised protein [Vibrio cholerae]CSC89647.1 Uncharacterised protein [Vibrio cholerae]CSD00937.1 Uncharacterised protein [Vibrio cholerae]